MCKTYAACICRACCICIQYVPERFCVCEHRATSSGLVARDSTGFIASPSRCRIYQGISDPLIIESVALRDACAFAREKGFARIIVETNCEDLFFFL